MSPNKGFELVRELLQVEGLGDTASSERARKERSFKYGNLNQKELEIEKLKPSRLWEFHYLGFLPFTW